MYQIKIIPLIVCLFFFFNSNAQNNDTIIDKSHIKSENINRELKEFSGNYTFKTKVIEKGKQEKIFTRDVNVYLLDVTDITNTYLLYCIKYGFDDPEFQPFLKKIAYLFDEIIVIVNNNGKIISIDKKNISEIEKRWEVTRKKILEGNSGKVLLDYLQTIDKTIKNNDLLYEFLQNDNMYGMLFNGMVNYENQIKQSKNKKPLKTIKISSKPPISGEKYSFQNGILIEAQKTEKKTKNTKLRYELFYNGKEIWPTNKTIKNE